MEPIPTPLRQPTDPSAAHDKIWQGFIDWEAVNAVRRVAQTKAAHPERSRYETTVEIHIGPYAGMVVKAIYEP